MIVAPTPPDEAERLRMIRSLRIIGAPLEPIFSDYCTFASELCDAPISLVSMVDAERQWFAGRFGIDIVETDREVSFCAHAITAPGQVMWVTDALDDERFFDNPLVLGEPEIRFYAGAPLIVNRQPVGTLSAISPAPRQYDQRIVAILQRLSALLSDRLEKLHEHNRLEHALEVAADAVIQCDERGVITAWRHGAEAQFGYSAEEAIGRSVDILIPSRFRGGHAAGMQNWRQTESRLDRRLELQAVRKDGTELDIELCLSAWQRNGRNVLTGTFRDISVRKAQDVALKAAKLEAEEATMIKSQFLANISHEIRTPLTAVLGFSELLGGRNDLPEQAADEIHKIQIAGRGLLSLVNDVIDFSRLEAEQFEIHPSPVRLQDVADELVAVLGHAAAGKGLSLTADVSPSLDAARVVDRDRLRQMLINLVGNAIKFTASGWVKLSVQPHHQADWITIEVRDSGMGIPVELQAQLFKRFSQVDGSRTRSLGGAGLGLAITRGVAEVMGGYLEVESREGDGSTFRACIPAPVDTSSAVEDDDPLPDISGLRVLIVDDSSSNRTIAERFLQAFGVETVSVDGGQAALDALAAEVFDAVLLDIRMPEMDGPEVLKRLRATPGANQATPVIAFTADVEKHKDDFEAFDGYVPKPISIDSLVREVAWSIAQREPSWKD